MGIIYGLIDSATLELRYIGQTRRSLEVRFYQHRGKHSRNAHLNNWLASTHVVAIILESDPYDTNAAEIRWISEMREQGARLVNVATGGAGGGKKGYKHTPEARAKIGAASLGHTLSKGARARISAANARRWKCDKNIGLTRHTDETRARISASLMGHTCSSETRAKISATKRAALGGQKV